MGSLLARLHFTFVDVLLFGAGRPSVYMTRCLCRCILLKKPVTQYNSSMQSWNLIIFFLNENYVCRLHAQEKKLQKYSILHSLKCHQNRLQPLLGGSLFIDPILLLEIAPIVFNRF